MTGSTRDPKGFYALMGVSPSARPETISAAFRQKARLLHPDVPHTGNADAFIALKTAYDTLADPIRRASYDLTGYRPAVRHVDTDNRAAPIVPHAPLRWPRLSDLPGVVWIGFVVIIAGGLVRVAIDLRTPPSRAEQAASRPQVQIVPRMVASTTQPSGLAPARTAVAPPNHPAAPAAAITAGTTLAEAIARPPAGQATGTDAPAVAPRRETQARDAQPHAPEVPPPPHVATSDGARTAAAIPQPTPAPPGQADTARPAPALHDDAGPAASSAAAGALLARGHTLLAAGDVVSARLLYERAATSGSAAAAIAAGMTHDPRFLIELGTQGTVADPQAAARWYRRAAALGDNRAGQLLAGLGVRD